MHCVSENSILYNYAKCSSLTIDRLLSIRPLLHIVLIELVSVQKREFLFEIKACEKNYHRHMSDIGVSQARLPPRIIY